MVLGVIFRVLASSTPRPALVTKLIIDILVRARTTHQAVARLWWLVAPEFSLAVFGSVSAAALIFSMLCWPTNIRGSQHAGDGTRRTARPYGLRRSCFLRSSGAGPGPGDGPPGNDSVNWTAGSAGHHHDLSVVSIILFSPWLLLLLVAGVVPAFLGESHFAFLGYAKNFRQTPIRRQLDYLRVLGGSKEAAKELKLFGLAPFLTEPFSRLSNQIYVEDVNLARRRLTAGSFLSTIRTAGYYLAYVFVIWQTVIGVLSIGTLTFLAGAIQQASSNIQQIFSTVSSIADQALFLTDLIAFFEMRPVIESKPNALPAPRPIRRGFEFRNVSFRYPGSSRLVLDGLNFHLHPGERVALIGENGEGKTTIVKLLTRLYDPVEGQVLLDGVDLREYNLEDLYREIGVIFQDFMRYEMTARENIAVGRIERADDLPLLQQSAQKSMADEVVGRLPRGYEQMLGRRFDGGVDLSGGEWQKVALARAYLRDAQILILDEPTAALDARSEYEVFQRFAELTAGKMALFISHRFSTVRMADRIVVLEGGRIAEEGDHEKLTRLGGRYAEMFELQAASYR